jgi:hypothetical protein
MIHQQRWESPTGWHTSLDLSSVLTHEILPQGLHAPTWVLGFHQQNLAQITPKLSMFRVDMFEIKPVVPKTISGEQVSLRLFLGK